MLENLQDYFTPEYQFSLEKIAYNKLPASTNDYTLQYHDTIKADIDNNLHARISLTRAVLFEPEGVFSLIVSFEAILTFDSTKYNEIDWSTVNLAEEFMKGGGFILYNLSSRISGLIASITSSFGQPPVVLPIISNTDR